MYLGTFHSTCLRLHDRQYFLYQHVKGFRELHDAQLVMGDDHSGCRTQPENLLEWLNKVCEGAFDSGVPAPAPDVENRVMPACLSVLLRPSAFQAGTTGGTVIFLGPDKPGGNRESAQPGEGQMSLTKALPADTCCFADDSGLCDSQCAQTCARNVA